MRLFFIICSFLLLIGGGASWAQTGSSDVVQLSLPDSLKPGGREVSGLADKDGRLYFLLENRDDHLKIPSAGIYSLPLKELGSAIASQTSLPDAQRHDLVGLEVMMKKVNGYQGLEAIAFVNDNFYVSVETELFADSCYILTGTLTAGTFHMDTTHVIALPKPRLPGGDKVFNAGFESLAAYKGNLYAFFEFNQFDKNTVYRISPKSRKIKSMSVDQRIPLRITDVAHWKGRKLIASNYFFPLKAEAIYQEGLSVEEQKLIRNTEGKLRPYARMAVFRISNRKVKVLRYIELPEKYWTSNWEGIAKYGKGAFLVNDKFIRAGGNETQLIYVHLPQE